MTAQPLRALVVEDDHSWQQIISEILSDCGLEVDVAGSLDEATLGLKLNRINSQWLIFHFPPTIITTTMASTCWTPSAASTPIAAQFY